MRMCIYDIVIMNPKKRKRRKLRTKRRKHRYSRLCKFKEKGKNINYTQKLLFYTSFVFLTNFAHALFTGYYLYSAFFLLLTITSIFIHSHYTILRNIVDKMAILCVVFYGGFLFYKKCHLINDLLEYVYVGFIVTTFVSTIYLYYVGYVYKKYCYCENKESAQQFHALLHLISSLGHHMILLL